MRLPRLLPSLLLLPLLCGVLAAAPANEPRSGRWAHEDAALKPDARVVWGRLDNGLRYALLPHSGVPGRISMKLVVLSGSMDERPEEYGIAHFTEHMCFHGSREMDETAMLGLFRRLGAEYGSDVNAFTTYDHTAYALEFRENTPDLVADGLRWYRGIADGVLFNQDDIDRERRVIFAEKRSRDDLSGRQMQASFPVLFRGLKFADHATIGLDETLRRQQRAHFLEFYRRCYRPDLMVFVAAGDFDVATLEPMVRTAFAPVRRPAEPLSARDEGRADFRALRAGIFRINGVGSAETMAACVLPQPVRPDSREAKLEAMRRNFVMELFQTRLSNLARNMSGAQASYDSLMRHDVVMASVRVPGQAWKDGVLAVDQVIRDTLKRGFDPAELEVLRKQRQRVATHLAEQVPVMDPEQLCSDLADSVANHTVFVGPQTEYAWMLEWLGRLSVAEVNLAFAGLWNQEAMAFHIAGDVALELKADEVLKTVQRNRRGELPFLLPPPPKDLDFQLKKPGPAAAVVDRRDAGGLGLQLARLSNNVRVNIIPSRQEPGLVRAIVRVGGGLLTLPGNQPALKEFGLNTLLGSGTVYYTPDQIAQIIGQHFLEFSFDVADHDAFTFTGLVGPENLEQFLGLATDFLRQPQFKAYAHQDERMRAAMNRAASASGFKEGMRELMDHLFKGDPRFMSGTPLDYISLGVAQVRQWMDEPLRRGYVEVTLVGDMDADAMIPIVQRTLGTLPERAAAKALPAPPRPLRLNAPPGFRRVEFVGELNIGMALGNWPVEAKTDMRAQAAFNVLGRILELRIRNELRDRQGIAYGPSAEYQSFGGFEEFALLQSTADCLPADAPKVAKTIEEVADRLAREGASAEEFEGARGIVRGKLKRAFKDNAFVASMVKRAQEKPERLGEVFALGDGLVGQLTLEEINAWAAKVLPASNCRSAALVPKAFVGIFDSARQ